MPEFILDRGTHEASQQFATLDAFAQGYLEAMFFTECHSDNEELEHATLAEIAPETLATIIRDCTTFQDDCATLLEDAYSIDGYDAQRAGNDYWYTRNGHGTGYWDRGLGMLGDELSATAHNDSSLDLYRGDDGLIYFT